MIFWSAGPPRGSYLSGRPCRKTCERDVNAKNTRCHALSRRRCAFGGVALSQPRKKPHAGRFRHLKKTCFLDLLFLTFSSSLTFLSVFPSLFLSERWKPCCCASWPLKKQTSRTNQQLTNTFGHARGRDRTFRALLFPLVCQFSVLPATPPTTPPPLSPPSPTPPPSSSPHLLSNPHPHPSPHPLWM